MEVRLDNARDVADRLRSLGRGKYARITGNGSVSLARIGEDLVTEASTTVEGSCAAEGTASFDAAMLRRVLLALGRRPVTIATTSEAVLADVSASQARLKIETSDTGHCATYAHGSEAGKIVIASARSWRTALAAVASAMGTDITHPNLMGVLLTSDDQGDVRVVATDGHRLITTKLVEASAPPGLRVTLRREAVSTFLSALRRLLWSEPVTVTIGQESCLMHAGPVLVTATVIDEYPDWSRAVAFVEKDAVEYVEVPRAELISALRLALHDGMGRKRSARMLSKGQVTLWQEGSGLRLSRSVWWISEAVVLDVPACGVVNLTRITYCNGYYLLDAAEAVSGETVVLALSRTEASGLMVMERPGNVRSYIMEMR